MMKKYVLLLLGILFVGCASTQETAHLGNQIASVQNQAYANKMESDQKMNALARDVENLRHQLATLSTAIEANDEKIKSLTGKFDELSHHVKGYRDTGRAGVPLIEPQTGLPVSQPPGTAGTVGPEYEVKYKEAFNAYQKGQYRESVQLFQGFLETTPETPLRPNAYYWMGEGYIHLKQYEKAILAFQEVIDKYPKSDRTPRAMLSQAEAFIYLKDKKSAETILKKVIESYPNTEESSIADRRLKNIGIIMDTQKTRSEATTPAKKVVVSSEAANIRARPSRTAPIIAWIMRGAGFDVLEEATEPGGRKWYKIKTKSGKEGWIHEKLVKAKED